MSEKGIDVSNPKARRNAESQLIFNDKFALQVQVENKTIQF